MHRTPPSACPVRACGDNWGKDPRPASPSLPHGPAALTGSLAAVAGGPGTATRFGRSHTCLKTGVRPLAGALASVLALRTAEAPAAQAAANYASLLTLQAQVTRLLGEVPTAQTSR